jgi:hypothetical protein
MAYTTIDKPTDYFNTKLYTGNSSTQCYNRSRFSSLILYGYKDRDSTLLITLYLIQ